MFEPHIKLEFCIRLDVDGLVAHGVKPGPLFKKIKSGEDIKLDNGTIVIKMQQNNI